MQTHKKIILWAIAAMQFYAVFYFACDIMFEVWGIEPGYLMPEGREQQRIMTAIGLILGAGLGWTALRMSIKRTAVAEEKLRHCTTGFFQLIQEHFTRWGLTPAEHDVALFLVKGVSTREIADMRGTSEGTIKAQTNAIYRKAGVAGRSQLLSIFIEDLMDDALIPTAKTTASKDVPSTLEPIAC